MIKNYILGGCVFLPVLFFAAWLGFIHYEISSGEPVKMSIKGYDPRDLLSGHYIRFQIDWDKTDCGQFAKGECPIGLFRKYHKEYGRFYVPEKYALALEKEIGNVENKAEMVYSYREGKPPYIINLLVNGKSWSGNLRRR